MPKVNGRERSSRIVDISSLIITNFDFSAQTISDNSFSTTAITGWTYQLNSDAPSNPVLARGTSAFGNPGISSPSNSYISSYQTRVTQCQYWLNQLANSGDVGSLYQTITIPSNYSQIRLYIDASGRRSPNPFSSNHFVEVYLNSVERISCVPLVSDNNRYASAWFTPPSGAVELRLRTRLTSTVDSTLFVHGIRMEGY